LLGPRAIVAIGLFWPSVKRAGRPSIAHFLANSSRPFALLRREPRDLLGRARAKLSLLDIVDEDVRRIVDQCYVEARRVLRENRDKLCGNLSFGTPLVIPDVVTIYMGSLAQPQLYAPDHAIFTPEPPEWAKPLGTLREYHAGVP
jgi:hypothetical protein